MYGAMSLEVLEQWREEMLREAELNQLKKALQANRKRSATPVGLDRGVGAAEGR